jgi:anti-anti-sigma factor
MDIVENKQGSKLILSIGARLDAISAPQLAERIDHIVNTDNTVKQLVIDLSNTNYMSSLGLRVLLQGIKIMKNVGGNLSIQNITPPIRPVFEMTGLMDLMVRDEKLVILRKEEYGTSITLSLAGNLTDETAVQFETSINKIAERYVDIYLDCSDLKFIWNKGFNALRAVRDLVLKNNGGILMLANVSDNLKRSLVAENLEELIASPTVSVKMERDKAFFSLTGCVDDLTASVLLRKYIEQILKNKDIKEIYFYLENLKNVSKEVVITFIELKDKLDKNGVAVKLTNVDPENAA